jgi:neurotransmitter:Na+ symporter, NSS family
MCWAEWTMGRYAGVRGFNSAPAIYTVIWRNRISKYFGSPGDPDPAGDLHVLRADRGLVPGLRDQLLDRRLMLGSDAAEYGEFFGKFVGVEADGALLSEGISLLVLLLAGVFICNFVLIYRGVSKGIETFCKIAMPVMIVLGLIVLVRVLTLGTPDPSKPDQSVLGGLGFMWNPHPEKLWDFRRGWPLRDRSSSACRSDSGSS